MGKNPHVRALAELMPPVHGADEQVDWAAAEAVWNTRFPADYMAFMAAYGGGGINGEAGVLLPLPQQGPQWEPGCIASETANARYAWETDGGRSSLGIDPDAILAWGVTAGPDILCWLTTDEDPDRWPVLVVGRHTSSRFTVHPYGMTEFLCKLFLDNFEECPVSLVFWDGAPPRFVHWREEQRRWQAGLNPDTGEPDPYAGVAVG
ncbi:SMI1/KNR4 family protein [Streptomyces sp. NPDC051219]|uniref:SMI1/KNR4 family protein n=1 Tax=Streptomyces sp. NPDC051219 TaxID=3155283 RepID=UPI00342BB765